MQLTCPVCAARYAVEAALSDDAARAALAAALSCSVPGPIVVLYLGLFRPRQRALSWRRAGKLIAELSEAMAAGRIRRRGRDWPLTPAQWREGMETCIARRDAGRLDTPLRDHAYLYEVLAGLSSKAEGAEEAAREAERRARPAPRTGGGGLRRAGDVAAGVVAEAGPGRVDPETTSRWVDEAFAALGRQRPRADG